MDIQQIRELVRDHARGMWRYRWLALAISWGIAAAGWLFVLTLPNMYGASAKVYVDTDSLMDPVFKDIALPNNLDAQVAAVSRAILTRPNIEQVALKTDLHLLAGTDEELEALVTGLQQGIRVRADNRSNVFDISFAYQDREKAREVVAAVVDAFESDTLQEQDDDTQVTLQAVEAEIEEHNTRLIEAEDRLANFKKENVGFMPNDSGDYYSRLQNALSELENTQAQMRALNQRRAELSRQLQMESAALGEAASAGALAAGCSQQAQIIELETQLAALQVDFTDKHPRIVSLRENIDSLRERCTAEVEAARSAGMRPTVSSGGDVGPNTVYENLRMMQADTDVELATLRARLTEQQLAVDELRANVDKIADVEKNLKQLNRDYDVIQNRYQLLISRRENLRSKERLDPLKNISFRILEPPYAGSEPVGLTRPLLVLGILVFAMGAGGVAAFGLNMLHPVFFSKREVSSVAGIPVLGSVSLLLPKRRVAARRRAAVVWAGGYAVLLVSAALVLVFHGQGADLVQDLIREARA